MTTRFESAVAIGLAALLAVSVVASVGLAGVGSVAAQEEEEDNFTVDVEFVDDPPLATDDQTVAVTVTNNNEDNNLTSPLIEIPLRDGIIAGDEFDGTDNETSVAEATVTYGDGETEPEEAYTHESTFRGGDALFITAEEVEADSTNTYKVNVTITSDGTRSLEVDVRPLNRESNNIREEIEIVAEPIGDLDIGAESDQDVSVNGEEEGEGNTLLENIQAETDYDISADISLLGGPLTIEDVTVPADGTATVDFTDPGDAVDPTVVAQTGPEATIISQSLNDLLRVGTAESPFTYDFDFELESDGGETYIAVEDPDNDLDPFQGTELDASGNQITEIDTPGTDGVTLVRIDAADDTDVLLQYIGYELGNVNLDADVNDADATTIAQHLAAGDEDQINMYGDVDQDGEISAVDAMLIQQYVDDNRDADYEVTN